MLAMPVFFRSFCCRFAGCLLLLAVMSPSHAGAVEKLRLFVKTTQTGEAPFTQTLSRAGRLEQEASGILQFSRPGKFRWIYQKPHQQQIVGDGDKLWVFDPDLNQVTVKPLKETLGNTPASLLAGSNDLEQYFTLKDDGSDRGVEWLEAKPKEQDNPFRSVRIGFREQVPAAMEMQDHFGNVTLIRFGRFERNSKFAPEHFRFVPPKGADVLQ